MSDGQLGGRLGAIIDWQITFYGWILEHITEIKRLIPGNASLDLARFIVLCPGKENRKEAESVVYGAYYSEMQRLYEKDGMRPGFSYEQVSPLTYGPRVHFVCLGIRTIWTCSLSTNWLLFDVPRYLPCKESEQNWSSLSIFWPALVQRRWANRFGIYSPL